jgi:hypothetical protein
VQIPTDLRLDPVDIEERGVLCANSGILSRVGILLSIYFLEGWRREKRQALLQILEDYLSRFASDITHYHDGERSGRRWSGEGLPESYRNLDGIDPDDQLSYHMWRFDPEDGDDASLWRIMGRGFARNNTTRRLSGLKAHFPPSFVFADPDRFLEVVRLWCDRLGALHGSAGLGVMTIPGSEEQAPYHYPFLMHYPGLEYDAMGSYWSQTRHGGYEKARSSNWLTILGDDNVGALGGLEAIHPGLRTGIDLGSYNGGIILRAGALPTLGNPENGGIPEAYRTVARLIKPIRFEGYRWGIIKPPEPLNALDVTLAWIRRFD